MSSIIGYHFKISGSSQVIVLMAQDKFRSRCGTTTCETEKRDASNEQWASCSSDLQQKIQVQSSIDSSRMFCRMALSSDL